MKDKALVWTVFTTGVILILFSCMVVMVAGREVRMMKGIYREVSEAIDTRYKTLDKELKNKLETETNNKFVELKNNYILISPIPENKKFKIRR